MKEKLLKAGINPTLINKMSSEDFEKAKEYKNIYDLENYLLALAIKYRI